MMAGAVWQILAVVVLTLSISAAWGHGVGFERLGPTPLGDRNVILEVGSSQYDVTVEREITLALLYEDSTNIEKEITFALLYEDSNITVRDVTFEIAGYKGDKFLFDLTSEATDGTFVLVAQPGDTEEIIIEEVRRGGFFDALLGNQEDVVYASGKPFDTGGLYKFDVRVTTAESFSNSLDPPIEYNVGISIPQKTSYAINDPDFGNATVSLITYYDEITSFKYEPDINGISFHMPFEWSVSNINETATVHGEFAFPKTLGTLLFTSYTASVNGLPVHERTTTVDGFYDDQTVVHMLVSQNELFEMLEIQGGEADGMDIVLKAAEDSLHGTITSNGQYRIMVDWDDEARSGHETTFHYRIADVFLRNTPVAVEHDILIIRDGVVIYSGSSVSTDSREIYDEVTVLIPDDLQGPVTIVFDNLAGNPVAKASIPVAVEETELIPDWIKTSAEWWVQGLIDDQTFVDGIEYLVVHEIIQVEYTTGVGGTGVIPDWIKTSAEWWVQDQIDDQTFADGIKYLIENGVISV